MSPATPGISTVATARPSAGRSATRPSTSGLVNLDGTGTITLTAYSDKDCNDDVFSSGSIPPFVTDNGDYVSDPFTPNNTGDYFWIASFSGDGKQPRRRHRVWR